MSLESELIAARKNVVTDGYDMSIGEISTMYRDGELIINPEFQRYFRWDDYRKTKFIESILLGIPIPPIFVFQTDDGKWELIDGLQRLSTLFEFMGILIGENGLSIAKSTLLGTRFIPSLKGKKWEGESTDSLTQAQRLDIKRARMRLEILKRESDKTSKFELFQRLNTGGAPLSEQEVRNCTLVMINPSLYRWIKDLTNIDTFNNTTSITDVANSKQYNLELVLRFFSYKNYPYEARFDVHEYLDNCTLRLAEDQSFDVSKEEVIFNSVFKILDDAMSKNAFKKWNGTKFGGKFMISAFEVICTGVASNLSAIERLKPSERNRFVLERIKSIWTNTTFNQYSGAGVRGTSRLVNLIPLGKKLFKP